MKTLVPVIDDFNRIIFFQYRNGAFNKTSRRLPISFSENLQISKEIGTIKNCSSYDRVTWDSPTIQGLYQPWKSYYQFFKEQAAQYKLTLIHDPFGLSRFITARVVEVTTYSSSPMRVKKMIQRMYEELDIEMDHD